MDRRGIVAGPHSPEKRGAAGEMRRHMTPAEEALWQRLRRGGVAGLHFRRQQVIDGYIADFYCHAVGLVVEVDGPVHVAQEEYDAERTQAFARRGLRVVRFTNDRVLTDLDAVVAAIDCASRERVGAAES